MPKRRSMTFVALGALCFVLGVTSRSWGHVAPSVDDNNRYLKVTPMADGIRFAYTVFFGEIPGASERKHIDANGDGQIDDAESHQYGAKLAAQVGDAVDIEIDGKGQRVHWSIVDVGMGSPQTAAGSFSVDLIAYLCGTPGPGTHRVKLRDQFRIPRPGETEVKVEDAPGVTVARARVGAADDPTHDYRFVGPGGPVSDDGLDVEFTSTASASPIENGACGVARTRRAGAPPWILIAIGGVIALGGAGLVVYRLRRFNRAS